MWHHRLDQDILELIGIGLRDQRLRLNLRQEDLASESGVSLATVQRLEAGQPVRSDTLVRCCRTLRLLDGLEAVFDADPPPSPFSTLAAATEPANRRIRSPGPR